MLDLIKIPQKPKYTLFVPFTRLWFVDRFLIQLNQINLPSQDFELVFYNDSDNKELRNTLRQWLVDNCSKYNGAILYTTQNHPLGENDVQEKRRTRIVEMKQKSIRLINDTEYVFSLEDDTAIPLDTFSRLLDTMKDNDNVGVVSGVQQGRHVAKVVGVWRIDPVQDPRVIKTSEFKSPQIEQVEGVGWYCYLTPTELYKNASYRFEAECLGPDVCYSWDLTKAGYKVLVDWSLICPHVTQYGTFIPDKDNVQVVEWQKQEGSWRKLIPYKIEL